MPAVSRAAIAALQALKIPGGNRAAAADVNAVISAIIDSMTALLDDKDQNNGYLGIDNAGHVNTAFVSDPSPSGKYLSDNGTWQNPAIPVISSGFGVFTGDGVTVDFLINHGMPDTPNAVMVMPTHVDAIGNYYISAKTVSHFILTYSVAPGAGKHINFDWLAKV